MSDHRQVDTFLSDFYMTAIHSILKIYADKFFNRDPYLEEMQDKFTSKKSTFAQARVYKEWFKANIDRNDSHLLTIHFTGSHAGSHGEAGLACQADFIRL